MDNMNGYVPVRLVNDFNAEETWVFLDPEPIAKALGLPEEYIDTEGYKVEITAGAIHSEKNWIAWMKHKEKETVNDKGNPWWDTDYFLTVSKDRVETFSSAIHSYNPFHGCWVRYIEWYGDKVACIYEEKHSTYGCTMREDGETNYLNLGSGGVPLTVKDGIVFILDSIPFSEPPKVWRYKLPEWTALEPLTIEKALEQGVVIYPPKSNDTSSV